MRSTTIVLATALLLAACSSGYEQVAAPAPVVVATSVDLAATSSGVLTSLGDTRTLTATVHGPEGRTPASSAISWTSSAPDIASVIGTDSGAIITATGNGTALITATSGSAHSTIGVTVRQAISFVLLLHQVFILEPGSTTQFSAVALDARFHGIPSITNFTFSSPDTSVVDVQPNGMVTAHLNPGADSTARIFAEVTRQGVTFIGDTKVRVERADAAATATRGH